MFAKQLFDEVTQKLSETIANSPAKDLEKNAKSLLSGAFMKMDLVTREEFEVQQQVLIKTRTKLSEMEARVSALETMLDSAMQESVTTENASTSKTRRSKKSEDKIDNEAV